MEVFSEFGINIDIGLDKILDCICKFGIGFMFVFFYYVVMKYVGLMWMEFGICMIFNLLGFLFSLVGVKC